jgi:hypothetical protein
MNNQVINPFTVEEIHKLRVSVAEQYWNMPPEEAKRDFTSHIENAKKTMATLREEKWKR